MTALKNKLSEKVGFIEAEAIATDNSETQSNSAQITSNKDNVILLKQNGNNFSQSVVPDFAITLNDARERISMLQSFVKEMMVQNVDYGLIPHCDKPSLFKPGAEKLCDIFGFSKKIEILNRIEDWEKGLFHYEVKVILENKRTGIIEAEGIGACNSKERKYKSQDSFSIINVLLKMAKKRALIDAVLSATRSSGIFTQDIEDVDDVVPLSPNKNLKSSYVNPNNKPPFQKENVRVPASATPISKSQQSKIFNLIAQKRLPIEDIKVIMQEKYNVFESKVLTSEQANDFIEFLKIYTTI